MNLLAAIADPGSILPRNVDETVSMWQVRAVQEELRRTGIDEEAIERLIKDRDDWQKLAESQNVKLADTELALAETMETIRDMTAGHDRLITLLEACAKQNLPESLRADVKTVLDECFTMSNPPVAIPFIVPAPKTFEDGPL